MSTIVQTHARSPWRLRIVFDVLPVLHANASAYTIVRSDGAGSSVAGASVWLVDTASVELALSEPLLERLVYLISVSGASGSMAFSWSTSPAKTPSKTSRRDPEAEALGVDVDWLASTLDPSGDAPKVRGRSALIQDLAAIAVTERGELLHRPDAGAAMPGRVNGPSETGPIRAALEREWLRDDRVKAVGITVLASSTGEITAEAKITPRVLNEELPLTVR